VWKDKWKPGEAYIGDAYFGQDYGLLDELSQIGSSYVVRVREDVALQVEQELPLRPEDLQANVIGQAWVRLGSPSRYQSQRMRLVRVQTPKQVLLLVTNLNPEQLSAQLVAELYRRRWQVELFFRWIKCILGCRHWLAQSPEGVAIQIYLALIGAALLQFYTERRPTRRMMELLWFYTVGMATADDLEAALKREKARLQPKMS
jgi:Transposase DDE domain.